jgi:hypothetical protein
LHRGVWPSNSARWISEQRGDWMLRHLFFGRPAKSTCYFLPTNPVTAQQADGAIFSVAAAD